MHAILTVLVLAVGATAGADAPPVRAPGGELAIGFSDPTTCTPNPSLAQLIDHLSGRSGSTRSLEMTRSIGGHLLHRLVFNQPEAWQGLRLVSIEVLHGIESGPANLSLRFADAPETALRQLRRIGFPLEMVGRRHLIDERIVESGIVLEADGAGSVLTCYSD